MAGAKVDCLDYVKSVGLIYALLCSNGAVQVMLGKPCTAIEYVVKHVALTVLEKLVTFSGRGEIPHRW